MANSLLPQRNLNSGVTLSPEQTSTLATHIKQCEIDKKDLSETKESYKLCIRESLTQEELWNDPTFIVGGIAISFAIGFAIGMVVGK